MRVLIFHTDLDGIAVGILAEFFKLPFDCKMSLDYGFEEVKNTVTRIRAADEIVMADLSMPQEMYEELVAEGKRVLIFDHHETSTWLNGKNGCVWDDKRSGTCIFFDEYVKPCVGRFVPCVGEFVRLVDIYDRWVLDSPLRAMSEDLQRVFVNMGEWQIDDAIERHVRFIKAMLQKFDAGGHFVWNAVELMHIRHAKESEDRAYQQAKDILQIRTDTHGRKFGVFSAWGKISMTCHRFLNIDKLDVDYLVCAQTFHDKWGIMSLRSREGEFDLLTLAGVAGHHVAAGAQLTSEEAHRFIDENMCLVYRDDAKDGDVACIAKVA